MSKKRTGGRVTPKGTQPAVTKRQQQPGAPTAPTKGSGPVHGLHGRGAFGPVAPTRSGHHRGNR